MNENSISSGVRTNSERNEFRWCMTHTYIPNCVHILWVKCQHRYKPLLSSLTLISSIDYQISWEKIVECIRKTMEEKMGQSAQLNMIMLDQS